MDPTSTVGTIVSLVVKINQKLNETKDLKNDTSEMCKLVCSVQSLITAAAFQLEGGQLGNPAAMEALQGVEESLRHCHDIIAAQAAKGVIVKFVMSGTFLADVKAAASRLALRLAALQTALGLHHHAALAAEFVDIRERLVGLRLDTLRAVEEQAAELRLVIEQTAAAAKGSSASTAAGGAAERQQGVQDEARLRQVILECLRQVGLGEATQTEAPPPSPPRAEERVARAAAVAAAEGAVAAGSGRGGGKAGLGGPQAPASSTSNSGGAASRAAGKVADKDLELQAAVAAVRREAAELRCAKNEQEANYLAAIAELLLRTAEPQHQRASGQQQQKQERKPGQQQMEGAGSGTGVGGGRHMAQQASLTAGLRRVVPPSFLCPITHGLMRDPVMLVETGHSFEREAIERHLSVSRTNPATNVPLVSSVVTPNLSLRNAIQEWLLQQQGADLDSEQLQPPPPQVQALSHQQPPARPAADARAVRSTQGPPRSASQSRTASGVRKLASSPSPTRRRSASVAVTKSSSPGAPGAPPLALRPPTPPQQAGSPLSAEPAPAAAKGERKDSARATATTAGASTDSLAAGKERLCSQRPDCSLRLAQTKEERELLAASKSGQLAAVVALLKDPAVNPNVQRELGSTPLHNASRRGHTDMAEALLRAGALVNAHNQAGWTPLHEATSGGHKAVVELLLRAGAQVDATNQEEYTPLHNACLQGRREVVQVLLRAGANVHATNKWGQSALDVACRVDGPDSGVTRLLRQHRASCGASS